MDTDGDDGDDNSNILTRIRGVGFIYCDNDDARVWDRKTVSMMKIMMVLKILAKMTTMMIVLRRPP